MGKKSRWGQPPEVDLSPVVIEGIGEIRLEPKGSRQTDLIFQVYGEQHVAAEIAQELRDLWNARCAKQEAA